MVLSYIFKKQRLKILEEIGMQKGKSKYLLNDRENENIYSDFSND
jgi:hypothetical protein